MEDLDHERALEASETKLVVIDHYRYSLGFGGYQFNALAYYGFDADVRRAYLGPLATRA